MATPWRVPGRSSSISAEPGCRCTRGRSRSHLPRKWKVRPVTAMGAPVRPAPLQLEQFAEAARLDAAYRYLGVLLVVHAELVARLEPRHHFLDPVDVDQVGTVHAPEHLAVEAGLEILDGAVVGLAFQVRRDQRNQAAID